MVSKVGTTDRFIERWDDFHAGDMVFKVPRLKTKMPRATPPGGPNAWADDFRIAGNKELIEDLRQKRLKARLQTREKYTEEITTYLKENKELQKKRRKLTQWENSNIERCIEGHINFTAFHYFYYNFCWIRTLKEKNKPEEAIRPNYRQVDAFLSRVYEWCLDNNVGMIMVKRRRLGATWMAAALCVWLCIFKNSVILFCSHNNPDIEKFLRRVKFINDNLPPFLRLEEISDASGQKFYRPNPRIAEYLEKDIRKIPNSEINTANAANESNFAGEGSTLALFDEIGENPHLRANLSWVDPQLRDQTGLKYAGVKFCFGTVGDMRKAGAIVKQIFEAAEAYHMIPVFMKGYYGTEMDEFGNDIPEKAIEIIQAERELKKKHGLASELAQYKQQFPLEVSDCWIVNDLDKILPASKISIADNLYPEHRKKFKYGIFFKDQNGEIRFLQQEPKDHPNPNKKGQLGHNQWVITQDKIYQADIYNNPYVAGSDPLDNSKYASSQIEAMTKDEIYSRSDISCLIHKRFQELGGISDFPVALYCGRPANMEEAYDQIALGIRYYQSPINIERNRGWSLINYLESNQCGDLVIYGKVGAKFGETSEKPGFYMSPSWESQIISVLEKWWMNNSNKPLPYRLIQESSIFSPRKVNTDAIIAWMAALQVSVELDEREKNNEIPSKKSHWNRPPFRGTYNYTYGGWSPQSPQEAWAYEERERVRNLLGR